MAQPTNPITAEYLRQLHARRAGREPRAVAAATRAGTADRPYYAGAAPYARLLLGLDRDSHPVRRISKAQDTYTHRLGWKLLRGAIPKGKELHHRCERHACWNPDHLELVTHAQNRAYARKTHCKHGHPLAGANLYLAPGGLRKCRECNRAAQRAFQARHRAPGDR